MIEFGLPWAWLLLPLPLLAWWLLPPYRQTVPAIRFPFFRRIVSVAGAQARPGSIILSRTRFQVFSLGFVWFLSVFAMTQPERVGQPVEMTKAARDVVLAIDISGSMDASDFEQPDGNTTQRLEGVKSVVNAFVRERQGDRLALIVFGSKAYVQVPLTEDLSSIENMLERTAVGMAGPHTALGDAIGLAIRTFEASDVEQRLLILLSDGTDTASRMSPVNAAEIARDREVEIHTVGVGDPEARGEDRVDVDTLKDIAARAGGQFYFAKDQSALKAVYERIDELTPRKVETLSYRSRESLAHIPMLAGAILGALALVVLRFNSRGSLTA
ncbi:VWA domain-containing protein [Marinobacter sp. F4206]|uniref:VWA domain-containing protein n=1 Tax=Marinobacter sp. F4206 TaxID=2861777 RepID=UPI001C5EABD5|nr:VWA domain-containing protein [Marinobacter sp. F4206]MBW4935552.1 VWA domain-containing protein [Marinobacter sp. F4206]